MRTIRDGDGDQAVSLGQAAAVKETEMALLVQLADGSEHWVPKSMIDENSEVYGCREDQDEGELIVRRWWAEKEGLA